VIVVVFFVLIVGFMLTYLGLNQPAGSVSQPQNSIIPGSGFLPPWATGVVAVVMLSAIMSSADSTLLSSSTILTELVTGDLDKKGSLRMTRFFIILMGSLSMLIAISITSVLNAMLISLSFFSGAFILPVLAGIAGWKVNKRKAYIAMIAGGFVALAGKMINELLSVRYGYILICTAYAVNAIFLFMPEKMNENSMRQQ